MSKTAGVTEAQISRAIRAAKKCGLRVIEIHPIDGTLRVEESDETERSPTLVGPDADDLKWADR